VTTSSLVLAAHGTHSASGHALTLRLADRVAALAGASVAVGVGFVDVREPALAQVLARAPHPPLVVPLFLSTGAHVRHDVRAAARGRQGTVVLPMLGARSIIATLHRRELERLAGTDPRPTSPVALLAAGSADPRARADVTDLAALLSRDTGRVVRAGFLSGPGPTAAEALAADRSPSGSRRTPAGVVLTHLLAPGHFATKARTLADDVGLPCTAPLLESPEGFEAIAQDILDQRTGSRLTPRWKLERNHVG
jgi:sirohydrochlorin ferrochelatase